MVNGVESRQGLTMPLYTKLISETSLFYIAAGIHRRIVDDGGRSDEREK